MEEKYNMTWGSIRTVCSRFKIKSNRDHSKNPCCPITYTKIRDMEEEFIKDWTDGILTKQELIEKYECPYTNITTRAKALDIQRNRLKDKININELCKDYKNGVLVKDIQDKYNICNQSIDKLVRLGGGVVLNPGERRKYELNEHYFDNIDTEIKAYYLGLFYADGTNSENRGYIGITLKEEDKYIIENLFNELGYDRPLTKIYNEGTQRFYYSGSISSKYLSNKFVEYGCMSDKSFKISFPMWLNENLWHHFIRGYFDGDGCLSIYKKQPLKSAISFTSNYNFLIEIQKILIRNCKINKTKLSKNANVYSLTVSGRFQLSRVLKYIYQDANIYLQRKYDKMQELIRLNIVNIDNDCSINKI
jgi:hypothetical protein